MTEPNDVTSPAATGHATIDDAMRALVDLGSVPLSDHHDRLAKAHETLHEALDRPEDQFDNAEPR